MTSIGVLQIAIFFGLILACTKPLGAFMVKVFDGQRTFLHPSMLAFDAPSREECTAERSRSNIPQQALALLNDPTYVEAARVFAERILKEGGATPRQRLAYAIWSVLSRRLLTES